MNKKQSVIIPRHAWILVRPKEIQRQTDSGLVIPDSVEKEQKAVGTIEKIGPKVEGLKVGQTVLYGKYAGEEIQLANKQERKDQVDYVLLLDEDILATIE